MQKDSFKQNAPTTMRLNRLFLVILVVVFDLIAYFYIRSSFGVGGDASETALVKKTEEQTLASTDSTSLERGVHENAVRSSTGSVRKFKEPLLPHKVTYAPTGGKLPEDGFDTYDETAWNKLDNGTCLFDDDEEDQAFEWQRNSPYAILLGTMKGGTHALSEYLWQHPLIAAPKKVEKNGHELHFFDSRSFERGKMGIPRKANQLSYAMKVHKMYPDFFYTKESMYTIHDSPRYLVWSDRIPEAIMCVTPWSKLIAVLRDPVERVISHYRFQDQGRSQISRFVCSVPERILTQLLLARFRKNIPMVDWETWIQDDIERLKRAGVLQDWNRVDFDEFSGSEAELIAWKKYLRSPTTQMIVGRGLYSLQIEHYFAAMDKVGKPRSDLLVIRSEELRDETQLVYNRVIDFLSLPQHVLDDTEAKHETQKSSIPIPSDLRKQLEELYRPYNRRLNELLDWNNVWDYNN
jgi:hypothetical protein